MSTDAYAPPGTDAKTSAIRSVLRAIPNTVAPLAANNWATEAPRPEDAPVTNATLPFNCTIAAPSSLFAGGRPAHRKTAGRGNNA